MPPDDRLPRVADRCKILPRARLALEIRGRERGNMAAAVPVEAPLCPPEPEPPEAPGIEMLELMPVFGLLLDPGPSPVERSSLSENTL